MMYGTKEKFEYFQCVACGCLQIREFPVNVSKYYPKAYYAFQEAGPRIEGGAKSFLRHCRAKFLTNHKKSVGWIFSRVFSPPVFYSWFEPAGVKLGYEILDVGCGSGIYLHWLSLEGFTHLTGVDPFVEQTVRYANGVTILKGDLDQIDGCYDFIMLNHSFEHMPDPHSVFKHLYRLISPGRFVMIRIPVVSSAAWQKYGVDWIQLDPPRHLFLHTPASMEYLANETGFRVTHVIYDSTEFQFWGSELYRRGIPLFGQSDTLSDSVRSSTFTKDELSQMKVEAEQLNRAGKGDQACFYLYKS
jgi:SAM-dependent methyltransferase